jgi:maleylpyruvate isomerase
MKLYGFWRSTATWRVRIALRYKGIAHEYEPVNLGKNGGEQNSAAFREVNPMRQVPVLELTHANAVRRLTQSMAILEYLEEAFPDPALLPTDAFLRARARQLAEMIVSGIQPLQNTSVQRWVKDELGRDERLWTHHWVTRGLDALEPVACETAGAFLVGDAVSFADLCLVPELHFARRFGVDLAPYPTLTRIESACAKLPSFEGAHAERQPDCDLGTDVAPRG